MRSRVVKGILVLYIIGLCFCCFWDFRGSIDFSTGWFGAASDKVVHFLLFFPFPILSYCAFPGMRDTGTRLTRFCIAVFVIGVAVGVATEVVQGWTGYRSRDSLDLVADCCGLAASVICLQVFEMIKRKRRKAEK